MAALPYIQLYVADYLADTAHLNAAQHGAYLLLIMNYWQTGKPLRNCNERFTNVTRTTKEEWEKIRPILEEFFIITDEQWIHKRIEQDLAKVREKSDKARNAVKQRYNERSTNVPTNVVRTNYHTDTDTDTEKENISFGDTKERTVASRRKCQLPPSFGVTDAHVAYAEERGLPDPYHEIEKFRNYHLARGDPLKDWNRAFQNWLIKAKEIREREEKRNEINRRNTGNNRGRPQSKTELLYAVCSPGAFAGTDYEEKIINSVD